MFSSERSDGNRIRTKGRNKYTASAKTSNLDNVAKALTQLGTVFKKDPKLTSVLNTPTLTAADKQQIVAELQRVAGGAAADKDSILKNFLNTLAENNRLGLLESIVEKFGTLMSAHRGEIELNITSAQVGGFFSSLSFSILRYFGC